jgi:uncharacterized protein (TIGR00369 family)
MDTLTPALTPRATTRPHATPGLPGGSAVDAWRQPAGQRDRHVTWEDPIAALGGLSGIDGRTALERVMAGTAPPPPIATLLGFALTEVDDGRVVMELHPGEHLLNPIGSVHGGAIATVLDSAMGCAVHSTLRTGQGYATADLQVRYVRAIAADGPRLRCEGAVVHRGSRVVTAEGRLTDADGRLYAHATTSCLVFG